MTVIAVFRGCRFDLAIPRYFARFIYQTLLFRRYAAMPPCQMRRFCDYVAAVFRHKNYCLLAAAIVFRWAPPALTAPLPAVFCRIFTPAFVLRHYAP